MASRIRINRFGFDGQPAAIIRVSRIGSEDILAITGAVMAYLDTSAQALPEGVKLTVWNDNSRLLEDRLATCWIVLARDF